MFLLDTDHLSILQTKSQPHCARIVQKLSQHPDSAFYRSIVSFHEQMLGVHASVNQSPAQTSVIHGYGLMMRTMHDYLGAQVLPYDLVAAGLFDSLRKQKVRIGTNDLRIASTALAHGYTLLTRNAKDFSQVPGLAFDDWTK